MSFDYPVRAQATVVLLLAFSLLSGIYGILKDKAFDFVPHYEVSEYQTRFDGLKQALPERGVLGYLGDHNNNLRIPRARVRYYLTQYTLAPLVIAYRPVLPLVIGNFHDTDPDRAFLQANELNLLRDSTNGVRLFRGHKNTPSISSRVPFAGLRTRGDRDPKSESAEPLPRPEVSPRQAGSSLRGFLSLALPLLIGFAFTSCFLSSPGAPASFSLVKLFVSIGIGLGISSCIAFFSLLAGGLSRGRLLTAESLLLAILAVLSFRQWKLRRNHDQLAPADPASNPRLRRVIIVCFFLAAALSIAAFAGVTIGDPHGGHDAWAIWNLRAKFLFKGGEHWADAFSRHMGWSNVGYPLLLPASVARGWTFSGVDSVATPITIAALFTFGTAGLIVSALAFTRTASQGLLAGSVLLCTPFFPRLGAWQVADLPLAFFFLSSLVLLSLSKYFQSLQQRMVFLAGLCAGFSVWTKNEGLLFFVATLLSLLIVAWVYRQEKARCKSVAYYVLGALPLLLIVWYFKTQIVPDVVSATANPIVSVQTGPGILSRLSDFSRHFAVLTAYQGEFRDLGRGPFSMPIILLFYLLVLGTMAKLKSNSDVLGGLISLVLMFGGYYLVYILAPVDLTFHSLDRVVMHLWPSALFVFFLMVRPLEEAITITERRITA